METIQTIKAMGRVSLENLMREVNAERGHDPELPFSVLAALQTTTEVMGLPISNAMFYVLLHYYTTYSSVRDTLRLGYTTRWLDDPTIKYWCTFRFNDTNYVMFLTQEQGDLLVRVRTLDGNSSNFLSEVSAMADGVLETEPFNEHELTNALVLPFIAERNSESASVAENTSRFSGATWFQEIQRKTIVLAGLGGIGSYVCFLLARMQPTSMFIYDDDVVEAANMSGQLYGHGDLERYKVDAMADMVENYASYNSIFAIREKFTASCEAADIMICGFDNMVARKTYFQKWQVHVMLKPESERAGCLFIDGRLSAEYLQVYCIAGDDFESMQKYSTTCLFSDEEADETVCSYKQTTYMANMIGSLIVNLFTNFVANEVAGAPIREMPFLTEYDGNSMQLKLE